ncbi:MAG: hypothetical protein PHR28_00490, partial [candidate division Zixibacteria bacterium]|nr:hypothetical protein [candidate division Zixibacteria bacterium]
GFNYIGGNWVAGGIWLPIGNTPKTLFVVADISAQATPNTRLHFEIPVNGCQYGSQNDGPRDSIVCGNSVFTISDFGLGVAAADIRPTYSIGQPIPVEIIVSNLLATPLDSVVGMIVETDDTTLVTLDSLSADPRDLEPGEITVFTFYYTGRQPGPISWELQAFAATEAESSAVVSTGVVNIQAAASGGLVNLIKSTPTAVTRGQENVFPLTLQCIHLDSASATAPLRLDSLRLRIEDATGAGIPADHAFSRIILATGLNMQILSDSIPAESLLTLRFDQPVIVMPEQRCNLSLLVDIDSLAEASSFRLVIDNPSAVPLVDDNTGTPVPLNASSGFPLRTAVCWINDPAQQVMVSGSSLVRATVNFGQRDVEIMQVHVRHTGGSGSSSVQVTDLTVVALDSAGNPVLPNELFTGISIVRDQQVMGERSFFSPESTAVLVHLSSPLNLNYGQRDSLRVVVALNRSALGSGFRMGIPDSTAFMVRDINTGTTLEAVSDTAALAAGLVFPMLSDWAAFRQNAPSPDLCLTSALPPSIVAGTDAVPMMALQFNHPGTPDFSSVRVDGVDIAVTDSLGTPLDPSRLFDRIGFRIDDNPVEYQANMSTIAGMTNFLFGDTGLYLAPGETFTVRLIGDIDAEVPYDNFRLLINDEDRIGAFDCSDGQPTGQTPSGDCPFTFPVMSPTAGIFLPAGRPMVTPVSLPTALSFAGDTAVTLFRAQFDYQGTPLQGDLAVHALKGQMVRRTESGSTPVAASEIFRSVRLLIDGQTVAVDTVLAADGIDLTIDPDAVIPRGTDWPVTLTANIRASAPEGNYLIQFADSAFMDVLDRNLLSPVYPLVIPSIYPLAGMEIAITAAGLEESFSNYPNPFFPSRGEVTTVGYVLSEDAHVDIEIFTITGELVKTIASQAPRMAGPHQSDQWTGANDNAHDVISGTYFCRITARYTSGKVESYRRKVAVIR